MKPFIIPDLTRIWPQRLRLIVGSLMSLVLILIIAGAVAIPFLYESSSLLYKFGIDRQLLLAGQAVGLVAGCLLLLQVILAGRLKLLDRVFGLNRLYTYHRINGFIIASLVIIHPIAVFISDDRFFIPLQWRYWPEFAGLALMLLIFPMVISSNWRIHLRLAFHRWWPMHRVAAILVIMAFGIHVIFVTDTFAQKYPGMLLYGALSFCGLLYVWIGTRPMRNRRHRLLVSSVDKVGDDAICLKIVSKKEVLPAYLPGQFGFITPLSSHVPREEHPFSFASSPTQSEALEFIVRTTGDWTAQLKNLQPEESVLIDGPFGLFNHLHVADQREIIMIAGGIGITPMLSMLRYMADVQDRRKITLLWSNQTLQRLVYVSELQELKKQLKGLRLVHLITRAPMVKGDTGRLDSTRLNSMLADCSRSSAIFVCGPYKMMKAIHAGLVSLGFQRRMIFMEQFRL